MADSKFFAFTWKGEAIELRNELRSNKEELRVSALKRIVASMGLGMDVAPFFPDVLNCVQTNKLEQKKLAYFYLTAQAHNKPELSMMAVNSLLKDSLDNRPLLRALSVRTLGYIRVPGVAEHLADPLRACLSDKDPYVRKTAAMCVAKLYQVAPDLVRDLGFVDKLKDLVFDSNAVVIANAIVALADISPQEMPEFNMQLVTKILIALTECNEWGQVYLLESIAEHFQTSVSWEVVSVCERVVAYLAHANCAVVFAALRVIFTFLHLLPAREQESLQAKLSPPLATLLSSQSELQYVALRNIRVVLQKFPGVLQQNLRLFFLKYNDPIYVKIEKLDILVRLAVPSNVMMILEELKEYTREVDVELVRNVVRSIGRCAIKLEESADRCVSTLLELVERKVHYIVEEVIIVFRDIFRKYPNKYEGVSGKLFNDLEAIESPEAMAALIWIIGEYSDRIEDSEELIEEFLITFSDDSLCVQLALLTASVKMLLKNPAGSKNLAHTALQHAVDSNCPDLRDRGFIYWRLLSSDPEAARSIVLAEKPPIATIDDCMESDLVCELLRNMGSLATVYHVSRDFFLN